MKKNFRVLIAAILIATPLITTAALDDTAGLEQISTEDLQQLQEIMKGIEEEPVQTTSTGNDFPLDIIWKSYTLVPADYPGKALPTALSRVDIYALAGVPRPENLTYSWIADDASSNREGPELSGRGKDTFSLITFQIPEFTHRLKIIATDEVTGKSASAALTIKTKQPEVKLYFGYNGNYNNTVGNTLTFAPGEEQNILARVFNFNTLSLSNIDFSWLMNGQPQEISGTRADILSIKISERTREGAFAGLKLELKNKKAKNNVFERAEARLGITIEK